MLQQTRVEVVAPYFESFLAAFPTVEALAAASEDEVLARWSGLGYYRRARLLRRAAREVTTRGRWPRRAEQLRELPGVGEYTAAAVASIAFGEQVPTLDGNVERVMVRRLGLDGDPRRAAVRASLRSAALELLDPERAGDGNQALMELGATVCTPRAPRCAACPLAEGCIAREAGSPASLPRPRARRSRVAVRWVVAVAREGERVLLARRSPVAALLPGLWCLPTVELAPEEPVVEDAVEHALGSAYGGRWRLAGPAGRARHAITHRDVELLVRSARRAPRDEVAEGTAELGWFTPEERRSLGTTAIVEKALRALARTGKEPLRARRAHRPPAGRRRG